MFKLVSNENNPNRSPFLFKSEQSIKAEPIHAERKQDEFVAATATTSATAATTSAATEAAKKKIKLANIEANINKLEDYLVFEKKKNHKQLNGLVQLTFEIERKKQAEDNLVKENKKHKEEIDELKRRLNDYQRLGNDFQQIKFDSIMAPKNPTRSNVIL